MFVITENIMKRPVYFIHDFSKKYVGLSVDEDSTVSDDKMISRYWPT